MSISATKHEIIDELIEKAAFGDSTAAATVALTHATLLLVEQQRIANLIAAHAPFSSVRGETLYAIDFYSTVVRDEVWEGLAK